MPFSVSVTRTPSVEDYLKNTYKLASGTDPVKPGELAARLDVSPPSVTAMVKRLVGEGLMTHRPYAGVTLTEAGRKTALEMIRRHRLIETFLVQVLGYGWDEVDEEAEQLEHAISPKMTDRIAHYLGHPCVDPHGAPIPTADGHMPDNVLHDLAELPVGARFVIRRVSDRDPGFLRYCDRLNLRPGVTANLEAIEPYGGPVQLRLSACESGENMSVLIGQDAACRIGVEILEESCCD